MQYRQLGRPALKSAALCLGTMNFGSRTSPTESFNILSEAVDAGINFIDTADQYGGDAGVGTTETILGQWLAQRLHTTPQRRDSDQGPRANVRRHQRSRPFCPAYSNGL